MDTSRRPLSAAWIFVQWLFLDCWREEPTSRRALDAGLIVVLYLVLVALAWISLNFHSHHRLYTDAGIFAAVAEHLLQGKFLYKEVWDHKPPMIYCLNFIPLLFGDGTANSIIQLERFFSVVGVTVFFWITLIALKNPFLAFFASSAFLFHFFEPNVFQGGNLTEEYAAYFVLLGIVAAVASREWLGNISIACCMISGLFFSLAIFTKEPFLLSAIPWFVFLFLQKKYSRRQILLRGIGYGIGALLPVVFFLVYFGMNGILSDWLDVLSYNYQYAKQSTSLESFWVRWKEHIRVASQFVTGQTITFQLAFLLGIVATGFPAFVKKYGYFPWVCVAAFVLEFIATGISGYPIGHYYLQLVGSYILVGAVGGAFWIDWFQRNRLSQFWVLAVFLTSLLVADSVPGQMALRRIVTPPGRSGIGPISQAIRERKKAGDTIWVVVGDNSRYYLETGLLSPTKYIYLFEHLFLDTRNSTREEKQNLIRDQLTLHPPTYIILSGRAIACLEKLGLRDRLEWINSHYEIDNVREEENFLYVYKSQSLP